MGMHCDLKPILILNMIILSYYHWIIFRESLIPNYYGNGCISIIEINIITDWNICKQIFKKGSIIKTTKRRFTQ